MKGDLIQSYRKLLNLLIAVLVFASGYFWGSLQHTIGSADPGVRTPALRQGSGNASDRIAGGSPFSLPRRGGASDGIESLMDAVRGSLATPVGDDEDAEDIRQMEKTEQELALLERETVSEMAQSLMESGIPNQHIEGILNGVAVHQMERGSQLEREMMRAGIPRPKAPSKIDLAQEMKASLLKASVSDADVEGMMNAFFPDLENPVPPDHPEPQIPPTPVP